MNPIRIILFIFFVILLTLLTEVGGILLLCSIPIFKIIDKKALNKWIKSVFKLTFFIIFYLAFCTLLLPHIAKSFDRVPMTGIKNVKPLNYWTCILNRHYVTPELKEMIKSSSEEFNQFHPISTIAYLDGCFPLGNIPLIPHLSHKNGKKLDLAFFYIDKNSGKALNRKAPSFIGYGVFVDPLPHEINKPEECRSKGYWQYGFLEKIIPQHKKSKMLFDQTRTSDLIKILVKQKEISKIFIEPHLKSRLGLMDFKKIRYHGCHAVRHDDHIHLQIN